MPKFFSIVSKPGLTVNLTIKRTTDGYYWTGSAWQEDSATVAMTETEDLANGYSEYYSNTAPDNDYFWWAIDSDNNLLDRGSKG